MRFLLELLELTKVWNPREDLMMRMVMLFYGQLIIISSILMTSTIKHVDPNTHTHKKNSPTAVVLEQHIAGRKNSHICLVGLYSIDVLYWLYNIDVV